MSVALEDLWDVPAESSFSRRPVQGPIVLDDDDADNAPRPSKRPRSSDSEALFLVGDSDEDELPARRPPSSSRPDIDVMFADLGNDEDESLQFQPLGDSIDKEQIRREAAKRAAADIPEASRHEVMPSSSPARDGEGKLDRSGNEKNEGKEAGKKERKKIAIMNEARLVGPTGFPALIKSTKEFVPRGKGHETSDLHRLLQVYQYWTHRMYPKTQFKDTVDRVERLCHSKRMHVSLSVWRDEAKGLVNGVKPKDLGDGIEADAENLETIPSQSRPAHSKSSSPTTDLDVGMESEGISRPPSSTTTSRLSDQGTLTPVRPSNDDEDMWDFLDNLDDRSAPPSRPSSGKQPMAELSSRPPDEDDEMWDIADEMGMVGGFYGPPPSAPTREQIQKPVAGASSSDAIVNGDTNQGDNEAAGDVVSEENRKKPTNDEDWDDMYL